MHTLSVRAPSALSGLILLTPSEMPHPVADPVGPMVRIRFPDDVQQPLLKEPAGVTYVPVPITNVPDDIWAVCA